VIVYTRVASWMCWNVLAVVTAAAAFWRGRFEERIVAAVMTVASLASLAAWPSYWVMNSQIVMAIDTIETAILVVIAVRSRLWWPSWCAAFHVMAVVNHATFLSSQGAIDRWAYVSGVYIWSWLGLIPLSLGTFDAWMARRQPPIITPIPDGATRR
jgi:hypothetical protein